MTHHKTNTNTDAVAAHDAVTAVIGPHAAALRQPHEVPETHGTARAIAAQVCTALAAGYESNLERWTDTHRWLMGRLAAARGRRGHMSLDPLWVEKDSAACAELTTAILAAWDAHAPPVHEQDDDCDVDPATECCRDCGVHHGDPCPSCEGRGFHEADCGKTVAA